MVVFKRFLPVLIVCGLSGCFSLPQSPLYEGPPPRPPELESYYSVGNSYSTFTESVTSEQEKFNIKRIVVQTVVGPFTVDYYQRHKPNDNLIFVFPVLGGKNIIADYFADYFAKKGFDTAIVMRDDNFKKPENFDSIEEMFRQNVVRDRIAIDFFEREYHKKAFGTFGISRGAINVAMTAGADPRLKYNILVMGGSDLPGMFHDSNQRRLAKYVDTVMVNKNISREELFTQLREKVRTDPKYLAKYMDSRNTLLMLAMFDRTVPIKYGKRLRELIGKPRTIYMMSDHYITAAYTQYVALIPPIKPICVFPQDFIESEALDFYRRSFHNESTRIRMWPMRILQAPFDAIAGIIDALVHK